MAVLVFCCCCCCFQTSWLHYRHHGNKFMTYSIQITTLWQLKLVNIQVYSHLWFTKTFVLSVACYHVSIRPTGIPCACLLPCPVLFVAFVVVVCRFAGLYCNKLCLHVHDLLYVLTRGNKTFVSRIRFSYFIHNVLGNVLKKCCWKGVAMAFI